MKYIKYLKYLLKHKWYVCVECFKKHLFIKGIFHDISKFLPSEFFPYADFFYGKKNNKTNDKNFDFAWLLHQKRNKHHWQWWILVEDEGAIKHLPMFEESLTEMICDWVGAGKTQGFFSSKDDPFFETRKWYLKNKNKIQLEKNTREKIETILGQYKISPQWGSFKLDASPSRIEKTK